MKIELNILNPETNTNTNSDEDKIEKIESPNWYMRTKKYETDDLIFDDDIINSPIGHKLDRLLLDNIQLTSLSNINSLITLLNNAKPCFG